MKKARTKLVPSNSSFGFVFAMVANGGGSGSNPKTYSILGAAFATNQFLLGSTSDNAAGVSLGWSSDPGDSPDPITRAAPITRQYDANVSPNNIRLSQVSIQSLRMTHGISYPRGVTPQPYLPTGFAFERTTSGAPAADAIVGDFSGCRRITVQLINDAGGGPPAIGLLANGIALGLGQAAARGPLPNMHVFHETNLGAIQVVNLSSGIITVGVHVETDL